MNDITIIGRLTRDPELRFLEGNGTAVCKFSVAVNRKFKKEETDFFECVAWRKVGELCGEYLKKGSQVALTGRMESRSYENRDGQKVKAWELQVDDVEFLSPKSSGSSSPAPRDEWNDLGREVTMDDVDLSGDTVPF